MTAVVDMARVASELRVDEHLADCARSSGPWRDCEWCRWAMSTPELQLLLGARADIRALLDCDVVGTVAWVVAATELVAAVEAVDLGSILVPSARQRTASLLHIVGDELGRLRATLDAAVATGGTAEQLCSGTAGAIAAAVVQQPAHAGVLQQLAAPVRDRLLELSASLSTRVQVAGLLPLADRTHWRGLPGLQTQPAWGRMPRPGDGAALRTRQLSGTDLEPGSLEALVVESLIDQVTLSLLELGPDLGAAAPPVTLVKPAEESPLNERTRSMVWRIARVDWHLTFVDTGRADCWNVRVLDDRVETDVPWQVALAIEACAGHGLISATHQPGSRRTGPT